MSIPDTTAVQHEIARFDAELVQAKSARDAQAVRDRFLGRKNSVVASWMQTIGSAPPDRKREIGRLANELKQAIEARWEAYQASATPARAPGSIDVTLPGREPLLGHRHPREDPTPLRDMADAQVDELMCRDAVDPLPVEPDLAPRGAQHARHSALSRRLTGTVGAQ